MCFMTVVWPALSYEAWRATRDTLHAHTQVLGKLAAALAPPEPQLQHAALRLSRAGLGDTAAAGPDGSGRSSRSRPAHPRGRRRAQRRSCDADLAHPASRGRGRRTARWSGRSRGWRRSIMTPEPQEMPWKAPLDEDDDHATYSTSQAATYFAAATRAALVLAELRAPYRGRSTPVNAWWAYSTLRSACFPDCPPNLRRRTSSCVTR